MWQILFVYLSKMNFILNYYFSVQKTVFYVAKYLNTEPILIFISSKILFYIEQKSVFYRAKILFYRAINSHPFENGNSIAIKCGSLGTLNHVIISVAHKTHCLKGGEC